MDDLELNLSDMNWCKAEIERLREELNRATSAPTASEAARNVALEAAIDGLKAELAASQAREAKLREALLECNHYDVGSYGADLSREALAIPHDDSALKERLMKERERCADLCASTVELNGYALKCAAAIRNLGDEDEAEIKRMK